ncbi:hypothetical protein LIER_30834 [Lithospermum erythrorhizon]|uniref:Uncharacterized protein n=1 Tax=Lithospermum erythrorhizon TaxID=34254 RepID=A0AAV3RU92_LITER
MQNNSPDNKFKNSLLMRHASLVFTPTVFIIIYNEYEAGMGYTVKEITEKQIGTTKVVEVQRIGGLVASRSPTQRLVNWLAMAKSLLPRNSSSALTNLKGILG